MTALTSPELTRPHGRRRAPNPARDDAKLAARRLAVLTLTGAVAGVLTVGVLGRLAMSLLAVLNPDAHGVRSDDGFLIGQFTLSGSLQLAAAGLQLGIVGAFAYAAARGLLIGPAWFRLLSISLGPGVVVGALLVEPHGVDFTRLHPLALAVALFIALPTLYVALLHLGAERYLPRAGGLPAPLVVLGLLPWLPLLPLTVLLLAGWSVLRALRRSEGGRRFVAHPAPAWVLRAGLAAVFVAAVVDLAQDVAVLT